MTCATVGFHSTSIRKLTGQILFSLFSCYYDNSFSYCFDNGIYEYFSSRTIIDYEYRNLFSLIFRAPETSYLPWHIVFGQPHWRQEFVFAMIPILFKKSGGLDNLHLIKLLEGIIRQCHCARKWLYGTKRAFRFQHGPPKLRVWRPSPRRIDSWGNFCKVKWDLKGLHSV